MKSSRQIDEVIGIHHRQDDDRHARRPLLGGPLKSGNQPSAVEKRLDLASHEGPEHEDAPEPDHDARDGRQHLDQRPDRAANHGGASSLRKRPIAIESGAANRSAPNEVTSVPMMNSRAPNTPSRGSTCCSRRTRFRTC